jgi:hypothetical protein
MDEQRLKERLRLIEALFAGATSDGERVAAAEARARILARLAASTAAEPPIELRFAIPDPWARRLFLALLRRYELKPYRYRGQRYASVMVRVPRRFVEETLWPEFEQLQTTLNGYLNEVTERVVAEVLQADASEAAEVATTGSRGRWP